MRLALDPAWQANEALPIELERGPLEPEQGVRVTLPLTPAAGGVAHRNPAATIEAPSPAARFPDSARRAAHGESAVVRYGLATALLGAIALMLRRLFAWQRVGHLSPLLPADAIDDAWLSQHVLSLKPEVVGAAYDRRTGAAEVAALLARLEAENKIRPECGRVSHRNVQTAGG